MKMLVLAIFLAIHVGCTSTITPKIVESPSASWDGTEQNSGLITILDDGSAVITQHAADRYLALVDKYGNRFSPPLKPDVGIKRGPFDNWTLDPEHFAKFATMNRWRKSGL